MRNPLPQRLDDGVRVLMGVALAAGAEILVSATAPRPTSPWLPFAFLIIVFGLAWRYGAVAGMLGSVASVAVFAITLYPPLGSLSVGSTSERQALSWMLLAGVAFSFLLAPRKGWRRPPDLPAGGASEQQPRSQEASKQD